MEANQIIALRPMVSQITDLVVSGKSRSVFSAAESLAGFGDSEHVISTLVRAWHEDMREASQLWEPTKR